MHHPREEEISELTSPWEGTTYGSEKAAATGRGVKDKSSHIKHMSCIYDCVEIHETVSHPLEFTAVRVELEGKLLHFSQKAEVSMGNISQRVRYCD